MTITFTHARSRPRRIDALGVGVHEGAFETLAEAGVDVPASYLEARGFTGGRGQSTVVPGPDGRTLVLLGLGPSGEMDTEAARAAGAALARAASRHESAAIDILGGVDDDALRVATAQAVVEGVALASYRFRSYQAAPAPSALTKVAVVGLGGKKVSDAVARGAAIAEAVCWARDLVNEPGGTMTPVEMAKAARAMARREKLKISVMDERAIADAKLGGLLGVNRGSEQRPRFITLTYTPTGTARGTVALVGKGITFDSGGLSIKTADGMSTMKDDMAGAAAVLGTFAAINAVAPQVEVVGYLPLTDNMTGPDATRPGDVLTIRNGTTVEVLNTDAEGRLVLADALCLASEADPDAIVDVATLTGAQMVALGKGIAGLMGNHDGWVAQVEAASARTGERVWSLPLPDDYRPQLDSTVADLKNIGAGRYGGALVAGLFLREFVGEGIPWAHVDIAGPAFGDDDKGELTPGGTGFGVRLLLDLLDSFEPVN
ncbi:MAG: leucyl aminopeptidase [Acidimicrobiales bacterium]|nr:leucyl aminopeptidase [Acidimicrobiales bacterium]